MAKLYFYYSAMNAGKSTTLLQSDHNYRERGMHTILFSPSIDTRYQAGKITSRLGLQVSANLVSKDTNLFTATKQLIDNAAQPQSCVFVDEAHFLSKDQVMELSDVTIKLRIPVLCYGLRTDFLGEPFPGSLYLLSWADELHEIKTICHCGKKATMTLRIDAHNKALTEGNQVEIGGNERYVSTCRKHFKEGVAFSESNHPPIQNQAILATELD